MTPQMTPQSSEHCRRSRSSWSPSTMLTVGLITDLCFPIFHPCCWAYQLLHLSCRCLGMQRGLWKTRDDVRT